MAVGLLFMAMGLEYMGFLIFIIYVGAINIFICSDVIGHKRFGIAKQIFGIFYFVFRCYIFLSFSMDNYFTNCFSLV